MMIAGFDDSPKMPIGSRYVYDLYRNTEEEIRMLTSICSLPELMEIAAHISAASLTSGYATETVWMDGRSGNREWTGAGGRRCSTKQVSLEGAPLFRYFTGVEATPEVQLHEYSLRQDKIQTKFHACDLNRILYTIYLAMRSHKIGRIQNQEIREQVSLSNYRKIKYRVLN